MADEKTLTTEQDMRSKAENRITPIRTFRYWISWAAWIIFAGLFLATPILFLASPYISWLPCPSWVDRTTVHRSDYRVMQKIFRKPLPPSFRITELDYPGYALINVIILPGDPAPPWYGITLSAQDYETFIQGLEMEKSQPDKSALALGDLAQRMKKKEFAEAGHKIETPGEQKPAWLEVYHVASPYGDIPVILDKRSTPTVHLYLKTDAPYK